MYNVIYGLGLGGLYCGSASETEGKIFKYGLTLKVKCAQKAPIFTFYQVNQEFQVNVVVQGLKVPREYKVNLEKLE